MDKLPTKNISEYDRISLRAGIVDLTEKGTNAFDTHPRGTKGEIIVERPNSFRWINLENNKCEVDIKIEEDHKIKKIGIRNGSEIIVYKKGKDTLMFWIQIAPPNCLDTLINFINYLIK